MVQARQSIQLPSATAGEQAYVVHARVDERQSIQLSSATARRTYSSITFPAPAASVDPTSLSHCEVAAPAPPPIASTPQSIQLPSATARCLPCCGCGPRGCVSRSNFPQPLRARSAALESCKSVSVSRSNFPQPLRGGVLHSPRSDQGASVDPTSLSHCETGAVGSIAYDNARQSIQLPSATARRYCPAVTATVPVASVDPTSLSHCEVGFLIRRTSTWTGVSRSNFPQPLRGRVARDLATKGFATRFASTYRQRGRWIAPSTSHTNASSFPAGAYGAASSRRVFDATSPLALSKGNWIGPGRPTTLRSKTQSAGRMSL